jgi:hypothetical protein
MSEKLSDHASILAQNTTEHRYMIKTLDELVEKIDPIVEVAMDADTLSNPYLTTTVSLANTPKGVRSPNIHIFVRRGFLKQLPPLPFGWTLIPFSLSHRVKVGITSLSLGALYLYLYLTLTTEYHRR